MLVMNKIDISNQRGEKWTLQNTKYIVKAVSWLTI